MSSASPETKHPLAVRLPNWVGDVCMCLPALDALRAAGAELDLYGRRWAPDLLAAYPATTTALPRGCFKAGRLLRRSPARDMLLFPTSFSSAFSAWWGRRRSLGAAGDWRWLFLQRVLRQAPADATEAERFLHLARGAAEALGLDADAFDEVPGPRLPLTDAARTRADALSAKLPRPWAVLCPLAVGTVGGRDKRWPGFADLAARLRDAGVTLRVCPGPGEEAAAAVALPEVEAIPGLDLQAYAALMARADLVVANDSGPAHLAAAAGARTLVVYGASEPARYAPPDAITLGAMGAWPAVADVSARCREIIDGAVAIPAGDAPGDPS